MALDGMKTENQFDQPIVTYFNPPLYRQRYKKIAQLINDYGRGSFSKVVDIGCSELQLFQYLRNLEGVKEVVLLDIDKELLKREMRVIRAAFLLIFIWTISWTPFAIVAVFGAFMEEDWNFLTPFVATLVGLIGKTSACINPYIYGILLPSFKHEIVHGVSKTRVVTHLDQRTYKKRFTDRFCRGNELCGILLNLVPLRLKRVNADRGDITGKADPSSNISLKNLVQQSAFSSEARAVSLPISIDQRSVTEAETLSMDGNINFQRFLLPDGQIVLAQSYSIARRKAKRKKMILCRNKSLSANFANVK